MHSWWYANTLLHSLHGIQRFQNMCCSTTGVQRSRQATAVLKGCICVRPQGSNILEFFSILLACLYKLVWLACAGCLSLLLLQGAERPFVVTGTCVCWSMFVNEPEVCTLAFDLLRFNTISSWWISCKLRFMVLRPKLRTSSCAPAMKVDDILAAWNPVSMIAWGAKLLGFLNEASWDADIDLLLEAAWSCWLLHSASQICRLTFLPVPQ